MADRIFVFAKRIMKQAMSKMYTAPMPLDKAEMGDRNYVRSSGCMNSHRSMTHKAMIMCMRDEQGYAWPTKLAQRNEIFAPKKMLSA